MTTSRPDAYAAVFAEEDKPSDGNLFACSDLHRDLFLYLCDHYGYVSGGDMTLYELAGDAIKFIRNRASQLQD